VYGLNKASDELERDTTVLTYVPWGTLLLRTITGWCWPQPKCQLQLSSSMWNQWLVWGAFTKPQLTPGSTHSRVHSLTRVTWTSCMMPGSLPSCHGKLQFASIIQPGLAGMTWAHTWSIS